MRLWQEYTAKIVTPTPRLAMARNNVTSILC